MTNLVEKKGDVQSLEGAGDEITAPGGTPAPEVMTDVAADGTLIQHKIGDPPPIPPVLTKILVRQIGLVEGDFGPFGFVEPDLPWDFSAGKFQEIRTQLLNGTYVRQDDADIYIRPLDVHCGGPTLYIFYLPRPTPYRKWRFARTGPGITLGDVAEADRKNYWTLRHVATDGEDTPGHHPSKDCRIVYFTARQTSIDFAHSYNIHLELLYIGGDAVNPNLLPIVIDPDIRHPGGSGE